MRTYSIAAALVAASTLLAPATTHMVIRSPSPISGSDSKNPLDASGSNFPCQTSSIPTSGGQKMAAGSSQTLAWDLGPGGFNTATHGGGSCQISVTYETDYQKMKDPSNWFVIHSFLGGCMTQNMGNLGTSVDCLAGGNYGDDCVNVFNFTIPQGVKNGHATMAWTWYNSVGNRELYMNCISAELTGGDGSEMSKLPTLFVANMADVNSCHTTEMQTALFPFPGKYVTKAPKYNYPAAVPPGCEEQGKPGSGNGGAGSVPKGTASASAGAPSASASGGASSASNSAPVASPTASAVPQPSASSGSTPSGKCTNGKVSCSKPGQVFCIGNTNWAECDMDNCAVKMAMPPGTQCKGGHFYKRGTNIKVLTP